MQHLLTVIKSELVEHAYQDPLMHKFIKSLPEDYKILFKGDGCVYSNLAHVMKNGPSQGKELLSLYLSLIISKDTI